MPSNSISKSKRHSQERRRRRSSKTPEKPKTKPKAGLFIDSEASKGFKLWLRKEWWVILSLIFIFILALFLRAYYYYPVATEDGYMLSGNDPFYHKQVIDHVQDEHTHLTDDPLINYPLIGTNPRPPVYDWSSAIAGMALAPFFGGNVADATWTFFIISPAFWGALTIFPVYFLGKEIFSKKAGLMGALLMGIMASHIERCPAGFADHDAMVLFFVVTTIFFLVKALGALKEKKWIEKWRKPRDIVIGIDDFFKENKIAIGYSVMSGLSIATVALIWKGFPYIFVIILGYFTVQLLFNHIKKTDSLGVFICVFITIATALTVSFPYYAYFTTGTWMSPLYLLLAMIFVGIFLVPTRDQPWLIVIPLLISSIAVIMSALSYFAPDIASSLFSGGGYFIRSKLYDTIAEAQAPDMSRLTISYGPVTFYLALIGLVIAAIEIPKKWKPNYMLIILWCGLAIYMAMSAVRFMFNATPVFAILGGWVTWRIIEAVDPSLRTFKRPETKFIYLYVGILTFVIMIVTYWRYYIELEDFELFQLILGLALIGIFSSLMAIYFIAKYNIYIGAVIFIAFLNVWLVFSWHDDIEVFLFGLIIAAIILVPILIFIFLSNKISGFRVELKHIGISLFIILLVLTPNMWFAVDSAIPYESKRDFDPDSEILGAFGHSFPSEYWQAGEEWLSEQDNELPAEDRPAFISWWDYGFWTTYLGKHPTVADNFQAGYQLAGSFIAAQNESEAISLFAARLLEGDYTRNKFEFSQGVKDIIIKYFDDGNVEDHPTLDKLFALMDTPRRSDGVQDNLMNEVESHREIYGNYTDIKIQNAVYAGIRVVLTRLDQKTLVEFLKEIEDETGTSIRYFAVDTRLFPFTAQNTGIFYAPIRLADRDINDFIKYYAIVEYRTYEGGEWTPFRNEPIPVERIPGTMNDIEDVVDEYGAGNVRVKQYTIKYTDMFYNSMFYHCYIGWYGTNVDHSNDAVPGISDENSATELDSYPPLQGWNMTHFRLVYRTAYWNPHNETELRTNPKYQEDWVAMGEHEAQKLIGDLEKDGVDNNKNGETDESGEGGILSSGLRQGVFFLKYYHGAIIHGKVTTSVEPELPVPGVRVTVVDEFGIPHDMDYTDKDGNYEIIAPFGECQVVLSQGGFGGDNVLFSKLSSIEQTRLAVETLTISDAQAMRAVPNYIIEQDFEVSSASLDGSVHWDYDDNNEYNDETDELIMDLELEVRLSNSNTNLNLTYEPTELDNGRFKFENVIPGEYLLQSNITGHLINGSAPIIVNPGASLLTTNISINPSSIEGVIQYQNSTPASGIQVILHDLTNNELNHFEAASNGTYIFEKILPGEYILKINKTGFETFEQNLEFEEGDHNITNITLIETSKISGTTWFDKNFNGFGVEDIQTSVKIYFKNIDTKEDFNIVSDSKTGQYQIELIEGNYTFYVRHIVNDISYVHLSHHFITAGTQFEIPIELEDSFKLNGTLYKLAGQNVNNATVTFESLDAAGNLTQLSVPTNGTGEFRVYLPYREYSLIGAHTSSGNVRYVYFNRTDYTSKLISRAIDIRMGEASRPWGYVYWDKNGDGNFGGGNLSAPTSELEVADDELGSPLVLPETQDEDEGLTGQPSGYATYKYPGETEIISGLRLIFTNQNGSVVALTNETGYFETLIPPGKNYISIDDERFEPIDKSMPPANTSISAPESGLDIDGIPSNIILIPKNITLIGTTWFDSNNNDIFDDAQTEIIPGLPIEFINISAGAQYTKAISDENVGVYTASLVPGIYKVQINHTQEPGETEIYSYSTNISLPYYSSADPEIEFDIQLTPLIKINYTIMYNDEVLTDEVAGSNLTIRFIDTLNNIISPLNAVGMTYEGYVEARTYDVWVEYLVEEGGMAVKYTSLSTHNVGPGYATKIITLAASTKFVGKTFVDLNGNNSYDVEIDEPVAITEIIFIREDGSKIIIASDSNGDYELYLQPDHEYEISINSTKTEEHGGADITVKYLYTAKINIDTAETTNFYNISLIKYLQVTGTVFFDENDNSVFDAQEGLNNSVIKYTNLVAENNEDPEIISATSNSTGYYELFLKPGGYEITIDLFGFREVPEFKNGGTASVIEYQKFELLQLNVSVDNPKIDLMLLPSLVEVTGIVYFDANENLSYERDEMLLGKDVFIEFIPEGYNSDEPEYLEFETKSILGTENEANKNLLRETGVNTLNRITVVKPIGDQSDSENFGKYSILLTPGTYNIHSYTKSGSGQLYAGLDQIQLELFEDSEYNLSMNKGLRVHGNVYYQDTDENYVYDISNSATEGGLEFKSESTDGELVVGYESGFYEIVLGLGNYTVSTSYNTREYEQAMTYNVDEILWIRDTQEPYDIKLSKVENFDISFTVVGESEKMISRGSFEKSFFTLKVENEGNVKTNVINLEVEDAPKGWDIRLNPSTLSLDLTEPKDFGLINVDVTTPLNALAENTISIKAEPEGSGGSRESVELKVDTPKLYGFEIYSIEDTDRGFMPNMTISTNITVEMAGNAGDAILFDILNVPTGWNASVEAGGIIVTPDGKYRHSYTQGELEMVYKNVSFKITSPDIPDAYLYSLALIKLVATSENSSKTDAIDIKAEIRDPDLTVIGLEVLNADLSFGFNMTVQTTVRSANTEVTNVPVSLYVGDVLIGNNTINYIPEDGERNATFDYGISPEEAEELKGQYQKFEVVVNGNQTISESQPYNNALPIQQLIGQPEKEEEFNWRPVIAALVVIIAIIVALVLYQRSKKI